MCYYGEHNNAFFSIVFHYIISDASQMGSSEINIKNDSVHYILEFLEEKYSTYSIVIQRRIWMCFDQLPVAE